MTIRVCARISLSKQNLAGYELQRSADAVNFQTITIIPPTQLERNTYEYVDKQPFDGMNYYRLKIVDRDSHFQYSSIVALNFKEKSGGTIDVVPNPVRQEIHVRMNGVANGTYKAEMVSANGQRIFSRKIIVTQESQVETIIRDRTIATGMYWLNIYDSDNRRTASVKLVVSEF